MEQSIINRKTTRRALLKAMGLSGLAALAAPILAACSSPAAPAPTEAPKAATPAQAAATPTSAPAAEPTATTAAAEPTATVAGAATAAPTAQATEAAASQGETLVASKLTPENWNPEVLRKLAGTLKEVDTKGAVAKVMPLDSKGKLTYWYVGPTQATPDIDKQADQAFWQAWNEMVPGVPMKVGDNVQNLDYNQMLDKLRTAAAGNSAPFAARLPIMWAVEFAAKGLLEEMGPEDLGYSKDSYWPGALKSVTWKGKLYGVPTNNETMAFIWNRKIFQDAGLDPDKPPATWEDVVAYSKAIKEKTGKAGYGLVARVNAGNTPFRFMPMLWAYGSGALDEAEENPTMEKVLINNDGGVQVFELIRKMYIDDKSVPTSALTNTQTENGDLFISGQIAMMISHPSEYASLMDKAKKATGSDKARAEEVVANTMYGLIPAGPVRRAVVFGGSNYVSFTDQAAGTKVPRDLVKGFGAFLCGPEWSVRLNWSGSNPSHLDGFKTVWMKERLDTIKFLDVTSSMLPYGIPFPVIPEANEIMNNIVPTAMQNVLTGKMTPKQAADDAAEKIQKIIAQRKS